LGVLDIPFFRRIRQNHALEHATIHILSRAPYRPRLIAHSDWDGFAIYGPIDTETVASAVQEALARLQAGESQLAVHPRCGTNIAMGGVLAGIASIFTLSGRYKSNWGRFWRALLGILGALILAKPLGLAVQERITTCPDLHDIYIEEIRRVERGNLILHKIRVRRG